jgi:HAD superfamily hydrolase (TIGR01509 family)
MPVPATLRAVIFDCDGVLFDSLPANVAYYNAVLRALGRPPMDEALEHLSHRLSTRQFLEHVFADQPELIERARAVAQATDYEPFYALMRPAPGLHELLAGLQTSYRLAMATNRGFTAREVMRRFALEPYLEFAVGILDVERPKPYPDMLQLSLQRLQVAPGEAAYVGDMISDYQAAQAAGMHFIAVGGAVDAPLHVDRLDQLPRLLAAD